MPWWQDQAITFDKFDTLHSAMAKLEGASGGPPVVVLAPDCHIADNVLLYRMLARASGRFGLPIAVVAASPLWRHLAREQGLRAFPSLGSVRRSRRGSMVSFSESLADSFFSALVPSIAGHGWSIAIVMLMLLLAGGAATYFLLPVMHVTVQAPLEQHTHEVNVRVSVGAPGEEAAKGTIPARLVEHRFTVSDFVDTTGSKSVGKERARGEVTIINSSPVLMTVPAGTALVSATGQRFTTTGSVTVGPYIPSSTTSPVAATPTPSAAPTPQGASGVAARVAVAAVEPGEKGNVSALAISRFERQELLGLTVFNEQPLRGGSESRARVASTDDRARLKEALFQRAQSQSLSELQVRVRQSESLIPHSMQVRVDREEYDRAEDEEAERLKGTVSVMATAIVFGNQDFNNVASQEWKGSLPGGFRFLADDLQIAPPMVVEAGPRSATVKSRVTGRMERIFETDALSSSLRGLSAKDAVSSITRLERPPRSVKVEIWPEWASRAYRVEVQTVR